MDIVLTGKLLPRKDKEAAEKEAGEEGELRR
jgi:hypothetical protein